MAISPGRLLDIQGVGDPVAVAQTNFEVLNDEVYKVVPTFQNGAATTEIGPPTTGDHVVDERWKDAWNSEWRCTVAGTPGTWRQEKAAVRAGEPASGTIPTGYLIFDSEANYLPKWHVGGYVWRPVAQPYSFDSVTGFTGGGTALDGIATANLEEGTIAQFSVYGTAYLYRLREGTEAEKSPFIIRPDDYTDKVWERLGRFDYPGSITKDITGLTGGTGSDLNGIPTVNLTVGGIVWFIYDSALVCYRLRTGTDATSTPTVIRPVDFQSTLNPKVWERVLTVQAPGDVILADNDLSEINSTTKRAAARSNLDILSAEESRSLLVASMPRPGVRFTGSATGASGRTGVNIGTSDFSILINLALDDYTPIAAQTLFSTHSAGNSRLVLSLSTVGVFQLAFTNSGGATTTYNLAPEVNLTNGAAYSVLITLDRDGLATMLINSISDRDKSGSGVTVDISGSSAVNIGSGNSNAWDAGVSVYGVIYSLSMFNRIVSASEALKYLAGPEAQIDKWAASSAAYTSDFSAGADSWSNSSGLASITGNIDAITDGTTSKDNVLRLTTDTSNGTHIAVRNSTFDNFKRYRITLSYYIPSGQAFNKIRFGPGTGTSTAGVTQDLDVTDEWTTVTFDIHSITSTVAYVTLIGTSGSTVFTGIASEVAYVKDITITQIGSILDLDFTAGIGTYIRDRSTYSRNHGLLSTTRSEHTIKRTSGEYIVQRRFDHGDISATAGTTKLLDLPPNCGIVDVQFDRESAFDGGITLNVGTSGTPAKHVSAQSVAGTGIAHADSASKASESISALTSIYVQKSGATTQGQTTIRVRVAIRGD